MKFIADENLEKRIVDFLRDSGHDVTYCAESMPREDDSVILNAANKEQRIIITNDKDFGELAFLQRQSKTGILLLRFSTEDTGFKIAVLKQFLRQYAGKLQKNFVVISETKVRIRPI